MEIWKSLLCLSFIYLGSAISALWVMQPNVIVIFVDDMGYGDSRVYNPDSIVAMPELERLAQDGVVFTDAHATTSVCAPSRYSTVRNLLFRKHE